MEIAQQHPLLSNASDSLEEGRGRVGINKRWAPVEYKWPRNYRSNGQITNTCIWKRTTLERIIITKRKVQRSKSRYKFTINAVSFKHAQPAVHVFTAIPRAIFIKYCFIVCGTHYIHFRKMSLMFNTKSTPIPNNLRSHHLTTQVNQVNVVSISYLIAIIPFNCAPIILNNTTSNKSYLILSYLILSYLILSYLILSYLILSYLILSYLILSYLILSYLILSYLILSYLILSVGFTI